MRENYNNELDLIRQLKDEPVPSGLRDRLMADASTMAAARVRDSSAIWNTRNNSVLTLKRLTLAAGFSIALLVLSMNSLGYAFASVS